MRDRKVCIKQVTVIAEGEGKELPMDKRLQRMLEASLAVLAVVVIAGIAKAQTQTSQPAEAVMAEVTQENGITYGEEKNTEPECEGGSAESGAEAAADTGRTGAGGKASVGIEAEILDELLREPDEYASLAIANVTASEEFVYAKTIEEEQTEQTERAERAEQAELEAQKALEEREEHSEQEAPELVSTVTPPETSYTSNEELRQGIVDYAMQYLGNKYLHGGSSLAGGTDCSGFTCLVYAQFGYSISRTPGGQYSSAGRSISQEELQPGDIVCYSSNGGKSCTHVGFYIGNGQILHSANSRKGVIISDINYSPVIGMRNVID